VSPAALWRELGEKRRLRRPSGGTEPADELAEEMAVGIEYDGLDLAESRRSPLSLIDTVLRRCDLSAAVWQGVTMRQVELLDCRALGLRLSLDLAQDVYLEGCRFDAATLRISRVRGLVVFDGCTFTDAVVGGDLSAVVFSGCSFDGAEFAATSADGCDLRGSRLGAARGLLTLRGAKVTTDQAVAFAPRLASEAGFTVEED
jgi:uncharacterized protein YjbI with pentapeptide repeats